MIIIAISMRVLCLGLWHCRSNVPLSQDQELMLAEMVSCLHTAPSVLSLTEEVSWISISGPEPPHECESEYHFQSLNRSHLGG